MEPDRTRLRKIDCHVHVVGDGSSGSGCWFKLDGWWKNFLGKMMVKGIGLPASSMQGGLDNLYVENLVKQVRESSLDAVVALAQDIPYSGDGVSLGDDAQFYVPNEYVAKLANDYPELIPACSIHPGRPDALEELERCIAHKMPVLKLLPNCLNVDYDDRRYIPFWERVAEAGMILLSHTGGEMTVKVYDASFGDPRKLRIPLECGVTVIAAHSAGRSGFFDGDWTEHLLEMFDHYPNLYADNSALCSINRARTIKHILPVKVQRRIIHGSDYPVPISGLGPMLMGNLHFSDYWASGKFKNNLEHDYCLKRYIGFTESSFTRMDELLKRVGN